MNVLFIGDIVGKPGRQLIKEHLSELKQEFKVDTCLANCENVAQGRGITEKTANELFAAGIDAFTRGNHLWDKREGLHFISEETRIVKPINFSEQALGNNYHTISLDSGSKLAIACVVGQVFMGPADSPFDKLDSLLPELKQQTNCILIDVHAEATAEKRALAHYFDGRVSVIVGTHTHIQTADEELLPAGTAYITDTGMTGPHDSVIGTEKDIILHKMTTGMPQRFEIAKEGLQINAIIIKIDDETGNALHIERIRRKY